MKRPLLFQMNGRHLVLNQIDDSSDDGTSTDSSDQGEQILSDVLDAAPAVIIAATPTPAATVPVAVVRPPTPAAPLNSTLLIGAVAVIILLVVFAGKE